MTNLPISNIETQHITGNYGGHVYEITLFPFRGLMYYDLVIDGENYLSGGRVVPWGWMILGMSDGTMCNVRFESYPTNRDVYPWWEGFGESFWLVEYTPDEYEAVNQVD